MRTRGRAFVAAGMILLVSVAGYALFRTATRETSEPASVMAAVERFRALPASRRRLPPAQRGYFPQPGVYVYATSGFEVSHVLGTRRHTYPSRTTITISEGDGSCRRERWDALATRWDATLVCPDFDLVRLVWQR